jgi:hypothetical protein
MLYKKIENPEGGYQDKDGNRCDLLECNETFTPEGLNVGWVEYPTKAKALKKLGLSPFE